MRTYPVFAIFLLALAVFSAIHAVPGFGDPDAYYHLAIAKQMIASGPVRDFTWLPFTTLSGHFADQHFLYHVALMPFLSVLGDFYGLKIATIVFAALAMTAFAWMLGAYGVRRPWLWTLPLLVSTGFLFRLLLTKATALALVAFFLGLGFLKMKKRFALFFVAFAYAWLHGSWPILGIAALAHAIVRKDPKTFFVVMGGLAAGFVLNPFFPENFLFNWEQIVQIAVLGSRDAGVQVGNEWSPVEISQLLVENVPVFFALAASFAYLSLMIWRKEPAPAVPEDRRRSIVFAASLACVFLLMALRQARHKEYFLPLALFAGALLGDALQLDTRQAFARLRAWWGRRFNLLLAAILACFAFVAIHGVWYAHQLYARRVPFVRFERAGAWMQAHVPPGEIVFHASWDDFPFLFYRDPAHRYIAGMDPLFLYRNDPSHYWLWRDIGDGRRREPAALIKSHFEAQYVFVDPKRDKFLTTIKNDPSFERVYADAEAEVWKITAR
ncbi:MAG: hypothetical protein QY323_03495 [Patescibacteria group bacterium]|nr:MAG: hypothetical protein QY323_03495 [Patescibacteria group bacterium]